MQAFLRTVGLRWRERFGPADPSIPNGALARTWREIAAEDALGFFEVQHGYIAQTHFNPVVRYVREATGLDLTTRSRAVQNVVWSISVRHGRAARIVTEAVERVGPPDRGAPGVGYDRELVNALYDAREAYVDSIRQLRLKRRYRIERRDALAMLDR